MMAPIDSRATFEAGGRSFTLVINFATLARAEDAGVDLLGLGLRAVIDLGTTRVATLIAALLVDGGTNLAADQVLPLLIRSPEPIMSALKRAHDGMFGDATAPLGGAGADPGNGKSA